MRIRFAVAILVASFAVACATESPLERDPIDLIDGPIVSPRLGPSIAVNAIVQWNGIEGGFWALRTADGKWLDPHETLPAEFRVNNLAVRVEATTLKNVMCFHMVGPIIAITKIELR